MDFLKKLWGNRTRQAKSDKTVVLREDRAQGESDAIYGRSYHGGVC
jgi:hypothetical protein